MSEQQARRLRRLRAQRPPVLPQQSPETAESVLPDLPRVGALDALLREVDSLRLTLETDLTLAASAVEAGAPQVAVDIVDSDRQSLRLFEKRALAHVGELAAPERRRFRVPAAPFVAAAAVAGFLIGVVPHTTQPGGTVVADSSLAAPARSLDRLTEATETGQTAEALSASKELHAQLMDVVAQASSDPDAAANALTLLLQERTALALTGNDSLAVKRLLAENSHLTTLLLQALPARIAAKVAPTATLPAVTRPSSSPRPTPTHSPSPKPSPSPSATPSPSSSSSEGPTLPGAPAFS